MSFFEGLKVIEIANILAGPMTGRFFAENGAEVIKIENPKTGGDLTRKWKLPSEDPNSEFSAYYACANYNKKVKMLDFNEGDDLLKVKALIKEADIVVSNFKFSTLEKFGLTYESLSKDNPQLIFAQLNGYPPSDSEDRPAFDAILQAETGFLSMTGHPDQPPVKMPVALIDIIASHHLREGILTALWKRAKTQKGAYIRTSLYESALASLANQATNYLMEGQVAKPKGSLHPNIAPYGDIMNTKDNAKILLAIGSEKHFTKLCDVLGLQEIAIDPRFSSNQSRINNRSALIVKLKEKVKNYSKREFLELMNSHGIPAGEINSIDQVLDNKLAEKMILEEDLSPSFSARSMATTAFKIYD